MGVYLRDRALFSYADGPARGTSCGCGTTPLFYRGGWVPRRTAEAPVDLVPRWVSHYGRSELAKTAVGFRHRRVADLHCRRRCMAAASPR